LGVSGWQNIAFVSFFDHLKGSLSLVVAEVCVGDQHHYSALKRFFQNQYTRVFGSMSFTVPLSYTACQIWKEKRAFVGYTPWMTKLIGSAAVSLAAQASRSALS
jgi:hypothetical protein